MATAGRRATVAAALRVVAAGTCWGLSAVIAKIAFDRGVPPTRMAEARVVVALAVLAVILLLARRELFRPPRRSLPMLGAFGLCVALVNGSYYVAIDRLSACCIGTSRPGETSRSTAVTRAREPVR